MNIKKEIRKQQEAIAQEQKERERQIVEFENFDIEDKAYTGDINAEKYSIYKTIADKAIILHRNCQEVKRIDISPIVDDSPNGRIMLEVGSISTFQGETKNCFTELFQLADMVCSTVVSIDNDTRIRYTFIVFDVVE